MCWPLRSLRIPAEVFFKNNKEIRVSVGNPISVAEQEANGANPQELGAYLRKKTYDLRDNPINPAPPTE